MKTAKDYLKAEQEKHVQAARELTRKAEDENRNLTDEEKAELETHLEEATSLKARVQELEDNERLQTTIDELGNPQKVDAPAKEEAKARTIGDAFVKSEQYQALKERGLTGRWSTGAIEIPAGAKTVGDGIVDLVSAPDELVGAPQVVPGIQSISPAEQRLFIADLFASGVATANSIVFLKEEVVTNDAYIVAEKAEKPDSYLEFEKVTKALEKIATFMPVSDEMLEDAPQIASYLNNRLSLFVRQAEETQLVYELLAAGLGTAAAGDIGGTNGFDAIFAGMAEVRRFGGLEPDAVLIHATDHARLTVLKDGVGGGYFSGGPYVAPSQNPWGLRAVVTTAIDEGTALVGAFREGATLWRRGGITVEASNSHEDYFRKNLTAIRAEERVALTVYRPLAFCTVDVTP